MCPAAVGGLAFGPVAPLAGQQTCPDALPGTADDCGVLRWTATGDEVTLWGVNESAPFAYVYRALGRLGWDCMQAINVDVLHFVRLGLNG